MENKKSPDFTLQVNETYSSTVATIAPGLKIFSKHQFLQEVCWMLSKITTTKSYKYIKIYVKKKTTTVFDFLYIVLDWQTSFARILGGPEASNRSEFCLFLKTFISRSSIDLHDFRLLKTFHNAVIQHCAPSSAVVEDKFQELRVPLSKLLI